MKIEPTGTIIVQTPTNPAYDAEFTVTGVPSSVSSSLYIPSLALITAFYWDDNLGEYVVEYGTPSTSFILPS